jgi:hypothetical protein
MKIKRDKNSWIVLLVIGVAAVAFAVTASQSWGAPPPRDKDGDGFFSDDDCDDGDSTIYPGALEVCGDGVDNNCDGNIDEGCGGGVTDTDGDGFSDTLEQSGFTLPSGLTMALNGSGSLSPCGPSSNRALCVDYLTPDLFIIVNRSRISKLPLPPYVSPPYSVGDHFDPLVVIPTLTNNLGLPVVAHELIETSSSDRLIAETQHAVRVNEQDDTGPGALGNSSAGGNPNTPIAGYGEVDLFTARIMSEVERLCSQAYICYKSGGSTICDSFPVNYCQNEDGTVRVHVSEGESSEPLGYYYSQNVLAHEVGHAIGLAPASSPEVTLWHFNPDTGWVLEQSIGAKGVRDRSGIVTVTLYISEEFHSDSKAGYQLK